MHLESCTHFQRSLLVALINWDWLLREGTVVIVWGRFSPDKILQRKAMHWAENHFVMTLTRLAPRLHSTISLEF